MGQTLEDTEFNYLANDYIFYQTFQQKISGETGPLIYKDV